MVKLNKFKAGRSINHRSKKGRSQMKHRRINTRWEVWSYDVLGNAKDGYEVNDRYKEYESYEINCRVEIANPGTIRAFEYCSPSNYAIRKALGITSPRRIETDGDDVTIYVDIWGYPIGELRCISHESLSPIHSK